MRRDRSGGSGLGGQSAGADLGEFLRVERGTFSKSRGGDQEGRRKESDHVCITRGLGLTKNNNNNNNKGRQEGREKTTTGELTSLLCKRGPLTWASPES